MLALRHISVELGKGTPLYRRILTSVSLTLKEGEFGVIIGDNGAGKSTLFRAIAGSVPLCEGEIVLNTVDVTNWSQEKRSAGVATVPQDPKEGTMEQFSLYENLNLAYMRGEKRGLKGLGWGETRRRRNFFQERLELVGMGLENRLDDSVSMLSGGQRQVLSLVMALLRPSEILLLDEITAALDPKISASIMELAAMRISEEKRTTLMITHNMSQALHYGERLFLLRQGTIARTFSQEQKRLLTLHDLLTAFEKHE